MRIAVVSMGLVAWLSAAAMAQPAGSPPEPANSPRSVRVTAEGYNRDDALKQALRKALEQGAGVQIAAYSDVQNFALIRDTIYSRAAGVVSDYRIVSEREIANGLIEITIEAAVRPSAVAQTWGEVQNVLDQLGRPRIMVWIDETIDGERQEDSIVERRIEQMLLKAGFDLVDRKAVAEIKTREADDARDLGDAAKLARLAKDSGAHLLIRGSADADRAGLRRVYGVPAAFYNCSVRARIYATDTGRLLVSESIPTRERGVRSHSEFSPQAARSALVAATFPDSDARREATLSAKLFESIMEQWSTLLTAGGDVELEVERIDFRTFVDLRDALRGLEGVRSVDGDFTSGAGVFRIKSQISAQTLAERLLAKPFADWLEVLDLKPNRIQAKAVPGTP